VPTGSALVEIVATLLLTVTVPSVVPPAVKVTVPAELTPVEVVTVAVNVTLCPRADGFDDDVTVLVVEAG
jgi:hypothetical protein